MATRPARPEHVERATSDSVALLVEMLDADPAGLTDGEMSDALLACDRLRSQLDAATARIAGAWDARSVWSGDGARSGTGWLGARAEVTPSVAGSLLKRARGLRGCPVLAGAYEQGLIGTQKVNFALAAREGFESLFAEHEASIVDIIRPLTVDEANKALHRWRELAMSDKPSSDGAAPPDANDKVRMVPTLEGRWDLSGNLGAVEGEIIANAIKDEVDSLWKQNVFTKDDGLTPGQRDAHALTELVQRAIEPGRRHGDARPLVHIVVDANSLLGLPVDDPSEVLDHRCDLTRSGPVPVDTAHLLLCEGLRSFISVRRRPDGTCQVLDASPNLPSATAAQRRALRERDRGCTFPGCDAPVERCDAHHIEFRSLGGPTTVDNLTLLCRFHHRRVHQHGFTLTRDLFGAIVVHRPDGTLLPSVAHGHQVPIDDPPPRVVPESWAPPGPRATAPASTTPPSASPHPASPPPRRPTSRFRPLAERITAEEREERRCAALVRERVAELISAAPSKPWSGPNRS